MGDRDCVIAGLVSILLSPASLARALTEPAFKLERLIRIGADVTRMQPPPRWAVVEFQYAVAEAKVANVLMFKPLDLDLLVAEIKRHLVRDGKP